MVTKQDADRTGGEQAVRSAGKAAGGRPEITLPRGRVLLVGTGAFGVTGLPSWALLMRMWYGWSLRAGLTHSAAALVSGDALAAATQAPVEGPEWRTSAGVVPHLELAEWPDLVIVAPATTAFIAKCALGMPDSLVLSAVLATRAPVVIAPSIPESTLERPAVRRNLESLRQDGFHVVPPRPGVSAHKGGEIASGMPDLVATLRFAQQVLEQGREEAPEQG
ncbi:MULTISPECIES: flavoprotein [Streptomyces]|uniref:flavoprotein n=1 Tax=Streptomyces TaxID=1883 RepID=UPI00075B25A6|nr:MULTISPECIES: flavoprotein [Streptomyces]MDX6763857.1 flavoprotein [Streptomyces sp. F8]